MIIQIKALPGSSRNKVSVEKNGILKVYVTQIAEKGKANKKIIELLADTFNTNKSCVRIIKGEKTKRKVVEIDIPTQEFFQVVEGLSK